MPKGRSRYDIALKRPGIMIPAPNNPTEPYFDVEHELSEYDRRLGVRVLVSPALAKMADTSPALLLQRICEEIRARVKRVTSQELALSEIRTHLSMEPLPDGTLDIRWSGNMPFLGQQAMVNPPAVVDRYGPTTLTAGYMEDLARYQAAGAHTEAEERQWNGQHTIGQVTPPMQHDADRQTWNRELLTRSWDERLRREATRDDIFSRLGGADPQERYL